MATQITTTPPSAGTFADRIKVLIQRVGKLRKDAICPVGGRGGAQTSSLKEPEEKLEQ